MKYTLHIAFSELVGDLVLQVREYAKKFGSHSANYIHPIRFDFSNTNIIEIKRIGKNCPLKDFAIFAMDMFSGIPVKWITEDVTHILRDGKDIEEFFEREFSDKIIEDDDIDAEMHLMFYVPLYEFGIYKHVKYIIENLPFGHKFVVNVIGITYDIAWACRMLDEEIEKDARSAIMLRNIQELKNMTDVDRFNSRTLLKHIFLFQNYNVGGWSQNFTTKKLIDVCANLSLALVEHYDTICHYSWLERPIYAINVQSRIIDVYLAVNHIFRDLFNEIAEYNVVNNDEIDKIKVKEAFSQILKEEISLIGKYKDTFSSDLVNQSEYDDVFNSEVNYKLKEIIRSNIDTFQLNISEQQYLYSLFVNINENTDFEDKELNDTIWLLEEMMLQQLEGDPNLLEAYNDLKICSNELSRINFKIKEIELVVNDLQSKLIEDYPNNVEITEEGYRIGNEVFKPYNLQDQPLDVTYEAPKDQILPSSVDLRNDFPEIKNQGTQGACTAFSLVSVIEYFLSKTLKKKTNLSEAFAYYNARVLRNETNIDGGATFIDIIQSIRDNGVCLEELCPYDPNVYSEKPSEEAYSEAESRKITEAKNVCINVNDVKSALAQGFPVIISARAIDSYLSNRNGVLRIPTDTELEDTDNNHAMVICGYIDKEGFFIVRNSWGKNFGDKGYCYLPYEYFRKAKAINQAYVVTGININGIEAGDLPSIDTLLDGKDVNAQYSIYANMLFEANRELLSNRAHLNKLRQDYLMLFNKITDYSNVELTLKDLNEQNEQERAKLEEQLRQIAISVEQEKQRKKNFFDRLRHKNPDEKYYDEKKKIEDKLKLLDHFGDDEKRKFRVRLAILNGLKNINKECIEESIHRQNLSDYYTKQQLLINNQNKSEEVEYKELKRILPIDEIKYRLKMSGLMTLMSSLGSTLSRVINGEIGLERTLSDLQTQVMKQIINEFNIHISDHLDDEIYNNFYRQLGRSTVMAQIHGGVPNGYGDETKYFFCNTDALPKCFLQEADDVMLLPISDNLRMCFLHIEKYDVDDFVIFKDAIDKSEELQRIKGESVKGNKEIEFCARLAAHVYGSYSDKILPQGCKVLDSIDDNKTGLRAKLYDIGNNNAICAFAGTQNGKDWINNITQAIGLSSQYDKALEYGKSLQMRFPKYAITFVGHSQGGGEAAYCSLHIGAKAITFNPAGLSLFTVLKGKSEFSRYGNVHAYIFWNDILNKFQDATEELQEISSLPVNLKADGEIHRINDFEPESFSLNEWHGIKGILRYFNILI